MRIALVTPIEPGQRGNGSAQRAAFWHRTLGELGDLTTIVVPILGLPTQRESRVDLGDVVVVPPMMLSHPDHPWLARKAPQYLGTCLAAELAPFDLVVGFKSYLGPFCLGLVSADCTPLVVDLDDDDAAFSDAIGDHETARRYRAMIEEFRPRTALMTSAQGFAGTVAVPNTFPVETAPPTDGGSVAEPADDDLVVMVGNLTYGPNLDGARWLADTIWPLVLARHPRARLLIAGHGSEVVEHGIGFVDDLTDLYRSAAMTVTPIHRGSGTRVKILESWVQRVPVVSTLLGIDGLDAVHGDHALIASDAPGFADQIVRLLDDGELRRHLADSGDRHVRSQFDPQVIGEWVRQRLERVGRPPVGPRRIDGPVATEVEDGLVVDDEANGVIHHLDPIASIVYSLCDGDLTSNAMAAMLIDVVGATHTPDDDGDASAVRRLFIALDQLVDAGLISDDPAYERIRMPAAVRRFRARPATYDSVVAHLVYSGQEYAVPDQLPVRTVAIDIGTHIGSFSALMVDSGAVHVVALEPQPDNHRMAQINLATEIEAGVVELRRQAIWSPPAGETIIIGAAPISTTSNRDINTGGHVPRPFTVDTPIEERESTARSETIDQLIEDVRRRHGDETTIWLKLDCEGAEWPALETAVRLGDIDMIVGEMHLLAIEDSAERLDRLCRRLESFGFQVAVDGDPTDPHVRLRADRSRAPA